jgi:hypothetical protein
MSEAGSIEERRLQLLFAELEAANACNKDLQHSPAYIDALGPRLTEFYNSTVNSEGNFPGIAAYKVSRRLRRVLMRVVADRYCRALLPNATEMIDPDSTVITELIESDPWLDQNTVFEGARGRQHQGDRGLIAGMLITLLLRDTVEGIFNELSDTERDVLSDTYTALTEDVRRLAAAASEELFGHPIDSRLLEEPFRQDLTRKSILFRERQLAFVAGAIETNLLDLLVKNNLRSQAEFFAIALRDLAEAYDSANCPLTARYPTSIRHLTVLSSLATLTDDRATRLVFAEASHRNLWIVSQSAETGQWRISGTDSPLKGNPLSREHRCPGPDALDAASPEHEELAGALADSLRRLTNSGEAVVDPKKITAASTMAAFAIGVQYHLQKAGLIGPAGR